ncbi:MAG: hypothetical protein SFT81_00825 [Candidatus Caenarcaniphilales bacterium]|nr:hypothetical protein [Candidatus Caenarcaniphilales bacterium]
MPAPVDISKLAKLLPGNTSDKLPPWHKMRATIGKTRIYLAS